MRLKVARLSTILLLSSLWLLAQTSDTSAPQRQVPARAQFFAGTVTALNAQQITVSRTPVGRSAEHRTFLLNPKTKMNRSALKLKSRVTVKYQHVPEGDVALEIQPQPSARAPKPS